MEEVWDNTGISGWEEGERLIGARMKPPQKYKRKQSLVSCPQERTRHTIPIGRGAMWKRGLGIAVVVFGMFVWLTGGAAFSQVPTLLALKTVPDPLKPWVPWVLEKHEDWDCPIVYNDAKQKVCAWPSRLHLAVTGEGGSFTQEWEVMRETTITLPGERAYWPQQVTRDKSPARCS